MGMTDYCRIKTRRRLLAGERVHWVYASRRWKYIRAVCISCPEWQSRKELALLKAKAAALTLETGILHVLDHKEPLNSDTICGLTVPANLRIVPWRVNAAKSNKRPDLNHDLFTTPEQLRIFA